MRNLGSKPGDFPILFQQKGFQTRCHTVRLCLRVFKADSTLLPGSARGLRHTCRPEIISEIAREQPRLGFSSGPSFTGKPIRWRFSLLMPHDPARRPRRSLMTIAPKRSVFAIAVAVAAFMADSRAEHLSVTFLKRTRIESKSEGLKEPSGLTLSRNGNALWTVSDDTKKIFKMGLDGKLKDDDSFEIDSKRLEGITLSHNGRHLFVVQEDKNEIIKIDIDQQDEVASRRLSTMTGFRPDDFPSERENKGLEGIAVRQDGGLLVIKEGQPGLLIEVSSDLAAIRSVEPIGRDQGFVDNDIEPKEIDFSGICFYRQPNWVWIVSDKAKRLYLYNTETRMVNQSFALGYGRRGEYHEVEKAEGIAFDPATMRLYIVSDEEARLYVYQLSTDGSD